MVAFEDVKTGAKQVTFDQVDLNVAGHYAAEDADMTLRLYHHLCPLIEAEPNHRLFHEVDLPLMRVLLDMEHEGVHIDADMLVQQSNELANKLDHLQKEIYESAEEEFNVASTKQLRAVLFDKLQLPIIKKTPKGQPSTSEEVLQELASTYVLPKKILDFRSSQKLKSTYTDKLPLQINPHTGRIHTQYNQTVTTTSLSSDNPNLQNIPVRHADGRKVRKPLLQEKGELLLQQTTLKLSCVSWRICLRPIVAARFTDGVDVHSATASEYSQLLLMMSRWSSGVVQGDGLAVMGCQRLD